MKIQIVYGCLLQLLSLTALATVSVPTIYAGYVEATVVTGPAINNPTSPTFSAIYRYSHKPSETILDSARVIVSEAGLRIDQVIDDSGNTFIANFQTDQLWFIDSRRELVHEVPVVVIETERDTGDDLLDDFFPGFIQFAPCQGMQAELTEKLVLHGHPLTRWRCHRDSNEMVQNGVIQEQLYSTRLGVVVWSKDADGFISELVDVRLREPNPGIFKPPSHYRDVDLKELIQDSSPIGVYQEPDEDLNLY